jgi:hypothetical protein
MDGSGYEPPEEAVVAEFDAPRRYINVLGVRIRGNQAHVWLLLNDHPRFEEYTCVCVREEGQWCEAVGSSGFSRPTPRHVKKEAERIRSRFS